MKTIYISGKIDGCDRYYTARKFLEAEGFLHHTQVTQEDDGFSYTPTIVNPIKITDIPNGTWQDYIERDLIYLKHCDTIYMLKDWKDSAGARVELEFARKLGLEIIYEEQEEEEEEEEEQEEERQWI